MGGRCPVSKMSKQFTGDGQPQRGAEGDGGRTPVLALQGLILLSLMRWPKSSRTLLAFREAGRTLCPPVASCSNATTQRLGPATTPKSLPPECNWGGPVTRWGHGASDEGRLGTAAVVISPGPRHIQRQNQSVSSGLWTASVSSGTAAETVVLVRWTSESLPPRMEKLEHPTCCCSSPWTAGTKAKSV